jgi:hypothetical protein
MATKKTESKGSHTDRVEPAGTRPSVKSAAASPQSARACDEGAAGFWRKVLRRLNARRLEQESGLPGRILLAIEEVRAQVTALHRGKEGQPGGLADGSWWSFGARGQRPPENVSRARAPRRGARPNPDMLPLWHPCRGAGHLLRRHPEVAAPRIPPATSGYPLATLRVDHSRMSRFRGALGESALPSEC